MGVWRTLLLGDWGNRMDIADNENRLRMINRRVRRQGSRKQSKDKDQDREIEELQAEVDDLKVALGTLSQILINKNLLSEDELQRADEILDELDEAP